MRAKPPPQRCLCVRLYHLYLFVRLASLPPVLVPLSASSSSPGDLQVLDSLLHIDDGPCDFCHCFFIDIVLHSMEC